MNKTNYVITILGIILIALVGWYLYGALSNFPPTETGENTSQNEVVPNNDPSETESQIKLYFYNPALDQGVGGVQCTRKGLVSVERTIPTTTMPLTESIKLLLRGEISEGERAQGTQSEFPLPDVVLTGATVENGVATLTFSDPQHKTVGGSCRVAILWAQIEATAKQFPTVERVQFLPEELFQP